MLARFGAVIAGVLLLAGLPVAPAGAVGSETFGCQILPGNTATFAQHCRNDQPASGYEVTFAVGNTSGTYSFAWSITGDWTSVAGGCGAADATCAVNTPAGPDHRVDANVTVSQAGQSATFYSQAGILEYCGGGYC